MEALRTSSDLTHRTDLATVVGSGSVGLVGGAGPDQAPSPQLRDGHPGHTGLRTVVDLALRSVGRCDRAGAILIHDGAPEVAGTSHPLAVELDRLQHELGEGPGRQACDSSSIVVAEDLATDPRWPSFAAHARRAGMVAAIAVPLLPEREFRAWCGWLTLYSRQPGSFSPASIALAETLALYCSTTVNSGLHAANLESALASRDLIGQAKGIIMVRRNVDDEQAFAILRRASQHTNRRLRDVAAAVVRSCGRRGIDEPPRP